MTKPRVVIDTNVLLSSLKSSRGASYLLISLIGKDQFEIALSVPMVFEYEDVLKRYNLEIGISEQDVDDLLDYLCSVALHQSLYFLWRPFLKDPKDDMVLELAIASACEYIVTYNENDFLGANQFGVQIVSPKAFLQKIGVLS
jgi:putative PIN family toxin of toxin-antitoxin system